VLNAQLEIAKATQPHSKGVSPEFTRISVTLSTGTPLCPYGIVLPTEGPTAYSLAGYSRNPCSSLCGTVYLSQIPPVAGRVVQTLIFYKLGFNQNYYTFSSILLIKMVLCSKFP